MGAGIESCHMSAHGDIREAIVAQGMDLVILHGSDWR